MVGRFKYLRAPQSKTQSNHSAAPHATHAPQSNAYLQLLQEAAEAAVRRKMPPGSAIPGSVRNGLLPGADDCTAIKAYGEAQLLATPRTAIKGRPEGTPRRPLCTAIKNRIADGTIGPGRCTECTAIKNKDTGAHPPSTHRNQSEDRSS
jgi:hypothetical protein